MPFNSSLNSYTSHVQSVTEVASLQHDYGHIMNIPQTHFPVAKLEHRPSKTEVVSQIVNSSDLEGGSKVGKFFKKVGRDIKKTANQAPSGIKQVAYSVDRGTRGLQSEFERSATEKDGLIRSMITRTLDEVPGMLGDLAFASATATGNPALAVGAKYGATKAGKIGRNVLKDKTGYGAKKKISDIINKYVPDFKDDIKPVKNKLHHLSGSGHKAPSARNELVKKVMKEQGLSLPKASKYIKEHNLY